MPLRNTAADYGWVTRGLHWVTALLIIGLIALGWYMVDLTYFDKWYNESLLVHKSLGMVVLALGVLTLAWRMISPSPPGVATLKPWERRVAHVMHHLLFFMVLAIPISGYLISTSAGKSVDFFGWFEIPAWFDVGSRTRDIAIEVHYYLAYATVVLVAMHAGAALKHQFIDRDGTLARMLWR